MTTSRDRHFWSSVIESRQGSWCLCVALAVIGSFCTCSISSAEQSHHYVEYRSVIELINSHVRQSWQDDGLRPSPPATDGKWCRRVYLDLIGRVPTVHELDAFLADRSHDRRERLVERLLGSEYGGDYIDYWTAVWTNTLIGRTGGRERRSLTNRDGMEQYLAAALAENKPYNQLVTELITATGNTTRGMEEYNGAVNFLVEKLAENGVQATAKTAQIFLGTAVECTQCHDHPFNSYRQHPFWELNAFFRQATVQQQRDRENDRRLGYLVDRDFAGEGRSLRRDNRREIYLEQQDGNLVDRRQAQLASAPIYYELRNGQMQVAYPVYIDGTTLADKLKDKFPEQRLQYSKSGLLEHVNRREALAELIVADRQFDRALVNRMWAHFFGYGFTQPFDDMGPHNLPSNPELLEELGSAFRANGFDLKRLMRWIVLSEPYSLSSRVSSGNKSDEPAHGATPRFSRFYVRQMQPAQLFASLIVATSADQTIGSEDREARKERWLQQFTTAYGTDDNAETTTFNGTIPQVLTLMNGELIRRACRTDNGSFLDHIARDQELSNREKIAYLYRAALARRPTKAETNLGNDLLISRRGDVLSTLQDIWWAVLNSNEFILIH